MKNSTRLAAILSTSATMLCTPVLARTWVEVGTEYEHYFDEISKGATYNYERLNAYTPYVRFSHSPTSNEWNIWGRAFKKFYTNEDLFPNGEVNAQVDRLELHYTQMKRKGSWRFRPGIGVRYNGYDIDRYEIEYRLYPQFDYFFDSNSQAFFSGHWYIGDAKGIRMSDTQSQRYTDWGYEAEFGWLYRFANGSSIKPHLYTEYDSYENNFDINYWQLRLIYSQKIGRITINPFIRYGLGRDITDRSHSDPDRWGLKRDNNYSRAGVFGNIGISGKWNLIYETYYQIEDQYGTWGEKYPDRDKFFAKFGIQRIF
ncbi:TPA: hypothetical protein ACX6QN_001735 [Photobacterium damselae]|uniref:hypothetical protein n=1 Tax=Photobacterium damselae TaxID=38293 RepID=UPI0020914E29|nr:hypothetical protein [Photobacterium damselae]USR75301.1 hypothetical protein NGM67_04535 [Photobacterium damselae]